MHPKSVPRKSHSVPASGRHPLNSRSSAMLARSTKVLRSMTGGTMRVHQRLKAGRAITLCWMAKMPSSSTSMSRESSSGSPLAPGGKPKSTDFGTSRLPTKPIA